MKRLIRQRATTYLKPFISSIPPSNFTFLLMKLRLFTYPPTYITTIIIIRTIPFERLYYLLTTFWALHSFNSSIKLYNILNHPPEGKFLNGFWTVPTIRAIPFIIHNPPAFRTILLHSTFLLSELTGLILFYLTSF